MNASISNPLSLLNQGSSIGKKGQLAPISFTNKSVDLKDSDENKNSESMKFNTSNYSDIYSEVKNSPESKVTTSFDKKFGYDSREKNEKKEDNKNPDKNNYFFKTDDKSNKEFDDQFNEIILEELENDNKINFKQGFTNIDDLEDSKKSMTQSNSNAVSNGYDNSVSNYKMDDFDHIEAAEAP